jgi:alkylation response protein AidB-like acyl-CoA dehydrogenase|tara:strand:+ start:155 stop:1288 length:1134 start_codon:yes stop_codon:yes gene_type:complete
MVLTEEQTLLRDTAKDFCQENAPIAALRKLRDDKDETGFSRDLWQQMVELGWAGITFEEEYGGLEFGYGGLGVVLEEAGRTLTASPLISTVLLCGSAIQIGGNDAQKKEILPEIIAGETIMALALEEQPHHAPTQISCQAEKASAGYVISGEKRFVFDGHVADRLIVVARTSGNPGDSAGITLFLVDSKTAGITITRTWMVDSRNAANIKFENVEVDASAVIGEVDKGSETLDKVLDIGRIGIAAEMLGSVQEVFERTVQYLKEREQFGVVIGSFQALKHRAAEMFCEIELAKSVVREALSKLDEGADNIPQLASLAKTKLCDAFFLISNEGIQMHGGIGMTDEFDIGFFLKRARVVQQAFGDAAYHRDRYASLSGF